MYVVDYFQFYFCSKKNHCGFPTCEKCNPETAKDQIKLLEHIKEKFAKNKALILSGNECLGRAMTFHYSGLPFTKTFYTDEIKDGCFGHNKSLADIYQLLTRILGSFKNELNGKNSNIGKNSSCFSVKFSGCKLFFL